jgi:hypothetical protein
MNNHSRYVKIKCGWGSKGFGMLGSRSQIQLTAAFNILSLTECSEKVNKRRHQRHLLKN